jgi:hypothetical protein
MNQQNCQQLEIKSRADLSGLKPAGFAGAKEGRPQNQDAPTTDG